MLKCTESILTSPPQSPIPYNKKKKKKKKVYLHHIDWCYASHNCNWIIVFKIKNTLDANTNLDACQVCLPSSIYNNTIIMNMMVLNVYK